MKNELFLVIIYYVKLKTLIFYEYSVLLIFYYSALRSSVHDQATRNLELTYDTNELATFLLQETTSSIGP